MKPELIYPIYLDTPMMTALLASMEGGIIEEAKVESKENEKQESDKGIKAKISTSSALLGLIKGELEGNSTKKISDSLESNYTTNVKYPQSQLFNRLRNVLHETSSINLLNSPDKIIAARVGEIIEITGVTLPDPSFATKNLIQQIASIAAPMSKLFLPEKKRHLERIKKLQGKQTYTFQNGETQISVNEQNKHECLKVIENSIQESENLLEQITTIQEVIEKLLSNDSFIEYLILEFEQNKIVSKVYKQYARNENVNEIHNGTWTILGKVTRKIEQKEAIDLTENTPLQLIQNFITLELLIQALSLGKITMPAIINPVIQGPSLVVAPIAIFC